MNKRVKQPEDKYVLRLPDGMRDRLKQSAEANKRSMNAEIIKRLEDTYDWKSYEIDFENGGMKIARPDDYFRQQRFSGSDEEEMVLAIIRYTEELNFTVEALKQFRLLQGKKT